MTILQNRMIYKCSLILLLSVWHFVDSEAFISHTTKSTKASVHPFRFPSQVSPSSLRTTKSKTLITGLRGGGSDDQSEKKNMLVREMIAECIGTFLIVQIGTGAVMSAVYTSSLVGLFQIASVWMIAVTIAICSTATVSGAHLNPAVSVAFALLRPSSFSWKKILPYSISQVVGAILASWTNFIMYDSTIVAFETANGIARSSASGIASAKAFGQYFLPPVTTPTAFLAEFLGTGILAFVIFALTNKKNEATMKDGFAPPIIGATVAALIAVLAPLTQAGFNPARDFGPRIIAFLAGWKTVAFQGWWVYVLAPLLGAPVGAALADKVLYSD